MLTDIICKWCGVSFRAESVPSKVRLYCSLSCGAHASRNKKHGLTDTIEHRAWTRIRRRCYSPGYHNYPRYGGRGIKVCERWGMFENFLEDMGPKPGREYTIERIDNDGDYGPSNCKWATMAEQNRNKSNLYTIKEDQVIRDGIILGLTWAQIGARIGKSKEAVSTHAYRMGLTPKKTADRSLRVPSHSLGDAT